LTVITGWVFSVTLHYDTITVMRSYNNSFNVL
jgi:hypothetical protein